MVYYTLKLYLGMGEVKLYISHELKTFSSSSYSIYYARCLSKGATQWRRSLRHCVTGREVAGSIPDSDIDIFHLHNPTGRTMGLETTQPTTEVSTRNISMG